MEADDLAADLLGAFTGAVVAGVSRRESPGYLLKIP
jgi:hypothetical protein